MRTSKEHPDEVGRGDSATKALAFGWALKRRRDKAAAAIETKGTRCPANKALL
jgi:hypothetical protein